MPRTKAELSRAVLHQLNVIAPEETPSAADAQLVESKYDSKHREWRDDGLVYWPNTSRNAEEIPEQAFQALCDLMDNEVRHQFKGDNPAEQRDVRETLLLRKLAKHMRKPPSGEPTRFDVF